MRTTKVSIGIQARTASTRLPRKVFELIDGKPILKHVIEACEKAAQYMNRQSHKSNITVSITTVVPFNDEIVTAFRNRTNIVQGPEHDVLSRYMRVIDLDNPDFLVRITSDCPLIPPFLITKAITTAIKNNLDYCSNVHENVRTASDGFDVEVISKKAILWANENAKDNYNREHVTTILRSNMDNLKKDLNFKYGVIIGYQDLSHLKISVDTIEDLELVRREYEKIKDKINIAEEIHGKEGVHRF